jgi:hypothetical protein
LLGVSVEDHIIVGPSGKSFCSLAERGLMNASTADNAEARAAP